MQEKDIRTPHDVFLHGQETFKKSNVHWVPEEEIKKRGQLLKDKFDKCKTIVGTQQLHSFEPAEDNKVKVKKYNASENSRVVKIYH